MESHPQNPEFRNNPENFRPWLCCTVPSGSKLFGMVIKRQQKFQLAIYEIVKFWQLKLLFTCSHFKSFNVNEFLQKKIKFPKYFSYKSSFR